MDTINHQSAQLPAFIFDLDGVLVDTAHYHYLAWNRLANELGFSFTVKDNEGLKGVSRMQALEVLLNIGGHSASVKEKDEMAARKNRWYTAYLETLNKDHMLPGAYEFVLKSRELGIKIALGSASKNARTILSKLELLSLFDVIVDGTMTTKAKPDPEVFLLGAQLLKVPASTCVVFEDAQAGIDAALTANMTAVGIGEEKNLRGAALVVPSLAHINPAALTAQLERLSDDNHK